MKIIDISMLINSQMKVYKNKEEKKPQIIFDRKMPKDSINESIINMNLHTGTHIDAPSHIIENGRTIDQLDINDLITDCKVFDFSNLDDKITSTDLESKNITSGDFIILKTKNSFTREFDFNYVYLDKFGAAFLSDKKIKGVGIDALGIERNQSEHETHKILMESNIYIIEGLDLKKVQEGSYKLIALPINIEGVDGSPIRAVLIKE